MYYSKFIHTALESRQYIIICSNKLEIEKMNNLFAICVDININSQWNLCKLQSLDN